MRAVDSLMLSAQEQGEPREARPEVLSPEKFSETHGSLFDPPKSNEAAELTDRLLGSEPGAEPGLVQRRNFIDDHIFGKMERDGVPHAPPASDIEFLRRVTLDLTGRIPAPTEVRAFLADDDPNKRDKLIDRVIDSEEYVEKWAYHFMDLFRANGKMGRGQKPVPLLDEAEPARRQALRRGCVRHHLGIGEEQPRGGCVERDGAGGTSRGRRSPRTVTTLAWCISSIRTMSWRFTTPRSSWD